MPKHYVTFGQSHRHTIEGLKFNHNVVARFDAKDYASGRSLARQLFGSAWCFDYHNIEPEMSYFPGGFVDIDAIVITMFVLKSDNRVDSGLLTGNEVYAIMKHM